MITSATRAADYTFASDLQTYAVFARRRVDGVVRQ